MENLLTLREVASMLRLSPKTLYKLLNQGHIPAIKVGSQWRFERDQIKGWLNNSSPEFGESAN